MEYQKNFLNRVKVESIKYTKFSFFLLTFAATIILSLYFSRSDTRLLLVSHNDLNTNGGPLTLINLHTDKVIKPMIPVAGCSGAAYLAKSSELKIYCMSGGEVNNLWNINLSNYEITQPYELPKPFEHAGVPYHSRFLVGSDGTEYYPDGGPLRNLDDNILTDAGVIIVKGGYAQKVFISDLSQTYFILKIILDEEEKKLWVMSMGNGHHVLINRIDLNNSPKVDFSTVINSYSGFDMILNQNDLVISVYRSDDDSDILVYKKNTGALIKQITLPQVDIGYNALSLLLRQGSLYVSSLGGLFALNPDSYEIKDLIKNNPESQFTYMINGDNEIFAIDSYSYVLRIPDEDRLHPEIILDAKDQGLTSLYFINN